MPFRPRLVPTIAAWTAALFMARLGVWQISRYHESSAKSETMRSAWSLEPLRHLPDGAGAELAWHRATLDGAYVDAVPVLVTGGLVSDEPGYHVILPFETTDGDRILVNRGWVPVTITAPELAALPRPAHVEGLLVPIEGDATIEPVSSSDGLLRWPLETDVFLGIFQRLLGPPFAAIASHSITPVVDLALLEGEPLNEERERKRGALPVSGYVLPVPRTHHLSYAAQWFGFASATLAAWAWASYQRQRRQEDDRA